MRGKQLQVALKDHLRDLWIIPVLALACSLIAMVALALLKTPEYSSEITVLVVQKYTLTDSYTASKSAEKIATNLAEVIGTSTFLDAVINEAGVDLSDVLSLSEAQKRKSWKQMVETEVVPRTSMLRIVAHDADPRRAEDITNSVATILVENGGDYHGAADTVTLKIVDTALTSDRPVRPNLLMNGLAAAVFGAAAGLVIVLLKPSKRRPKKSTTSGPGQQDSPSDVIDMQVNSITVSSEPAVASYSVLDVTNYHVELSNTDLDALQLSGPQVGYLSAEMSAEVAN